MSKTSLGKYKRPSKNSKLSKKSKKRIHTRKSKRRTHTRIRDMYITSDKSEDLQFHISYISYLGRKKV